MSKVVLYYFDGRGRAEAIRWMLAACNIEFDEVFLKTREEFLKMIENGLFLYEQFYRDMTEIYNYLLRTPSKVPMLEIDGMKLCQAGAIIRYLARKGNMYGSDAKQQALIDMYAYGIDDMYTPLLAIPFHSIEARKNLFENAKKKLLNRYLPVFEKALIDSKTSFVANTEKQSMADVLFIMALSLYIEREETILDSFPAIKNWFETQKKTPWVEKFLAPGSKRKPPPDDEYVLTVKKVLAF